VAFADKVTRKLRAAGTAVSLFCQDEYLDSLRGVDDQVNRANAQLAAVC
jgi:hypothetical protein